MIQATFNGRIKSIVTASKFGQDGEQFTHARIVLEVESPEDETLSSLHKLEGQPIVAVRVYVETVLDG